MRMKTEEAEDLLSRVKAGQVTVGILQQYLFVTVGIYLLNNMC